MKNIQDISYIPFGRFDFPKERMIKDIFKYFAAFDYRFNYREFDIETVSEVVKFFNEKTGLINIDAVEEYRAPGYLDGDINIYTRYNDGMGVKYIGLEYTAFRLTSLSLLKDRTTILKSWYR